MRRFLVASHTVPPDGDYPLDDLAGAGGRVDVLCRCITAAMWRSHSLRDDTEVVLVFTKETDAPRAVRFSPGIHRLQPDERSTAARIRQALGHPCPDPWWEEVQSGLHVAPFSLQDVLQDVGGSVVVLDRDGEPLQQCLEGFAAGDACFVLSDHKPFDASQVRVLDAADHRVSLGADWMLGSQAIAVLQHRLDQA